MANAEIDVSGTPPTGTYTKTSGSNQITVTAGGQITVKYIGNNTLTFNRASGETWKFTGVTIDPSGGAVTQLGPIKEAQIVLSDNDTEVGNYSYTLETDAGDFDPQILNRPT